MDIEVSRGADPATGSMIHLTKREIEVLSLVIEGKSSKEVAEHIYISKRTVDFHLANIYKKLDVTNRVQAFREATRRNLLPVGDFLGMMS
ncbi:MAG: helix-turn-helix transcriptional regulator [Armatimonadetes bacterium]|nr:helix-turn-helix transcriptional regulator [Armatimonadota bacterium]